jgi:hypothetical protein
MKNLIIFGIFIIAMILVQFAHAQSAEDVIEKYLNVMGGTTKLASLNSFRKEGSMSVQGADVSVIITKLNGVGARKDISVMGLQNYQIVTPSAATVFMPIMGQKAAEPMPDDQFKIEQNEIDAKDIFIDYKKNGITIILKNKETVDGVACNPIQVTFKKGMVTQFYFDAKTYYLFKTVSVVKIDGAEAEIFTTYTNYKQNADGYWFAYTNTNNRGEINFDKIETNLTVDVNIFK